MLASDEAVRDSSGLSPEKLEELKLKQKFPQVAGGGNSQFLQRRLQQKQKYFDSGDYNMAKASLKQLQLQKTSGLAQNPKLAVVIEPEGSRSPTGSEIPTPETVPARKASIINPAAQCKLSPQPIAHHSLTPGEQETQSG